MRTAAFLAVFTFAGAAHADGFFITLNGVRVHATQFQNTPAVAPMIGNVKGQTPRFSSAHIEIGDWGKLLLPSLTALNGGTKGTAIVEFTKPDARGVEQVYQTASFSDVYVTQWDASFTPARSTNTIDFAYDKVVFAATTTTGTKPEEAVLPLDDATMNGIIVGTAPHLVSATISFSRVFDPNTGNLGSIKGKPITAVRAHSTTMLTIKSISELDFLQKGVARFALELENASVSSITGDTVIFAFPKAKLVDKTVGSQVLMTL